jgi:NitT/TauT family transport system substrate-binding protein
VERSAFAIRVLTLLCTVMLGCGTVASAAPDSVKVGVASIYPTYSLFFAAKELGYYQAANLDVDIQTFRGGPAALEALAAGAVDLCSILPSAAALAQEKGVKERIVALYAPPRPVGWYIMVPKDSPIKTMADLNGKTVGVTQIGSLTDFWVQQTAKGAHIKVTSVPLGGGVETGLRAKQVDAAILWPLGSYKGLVTGELRSISDLEAALPPTISEGVASTQDMIDRRSDVLKRWLAATSKALDYMKTHETWTEAFLKKYFDDSNADDKAIAMVYKNFIMKINTDGSMRPEWEKTSLESLAGTPNPPKAEQVFTSQFVPVKFR